MVTRVENDTLTQISKGTPMGEYFRRFWQPALASDEVPAPDCPPVRVRLMGENLIAFRDTNGKVGLVGQYCKHRQTDLFFGRNEEGGLRCAYHGWKFDVNGQCLELPTEPADSRLRTEVKITAYPTQEYAGIVWAYLGPKEIPVEFPHLEFNYLPKENIFFRKSLLECNFMQALEGQFDSSHIGFLHSFVAQRKGAPSVSGITLGKSDAADSVRSTIPKMEIQDTDYGFMLAAKRPGANSKAYLRITQWCLPNHTFIANPPGETLLWDTWVPMDDHHTWVYRISYNPWRAITDKEKYEFNTAGLMPMSVQNIPGTHLPIRNKRNDYLIDRFIQREFTYSGIQGNNGQDAAIIENQGPTPIYDRTLETLGATDLGIARSRRRLLAEAKAVQEGKEPKLPRNGKLFAVRPIAVFINDDGTPFHEQPEAKKYIYLDEYPQQERESVPAK
jgi:phenylpropionate dioxygenase-like ring-hydroxylating dioxygenase large terminal subunit